MMPSLGECFPCVVLDIPARFPQNLCNEVLHFKSAAATVTIGLASVENASDYLAAQH
jgi:hypothetical protein